MIATRRPRADSQRIRSVPPFGIAWQAFSARLRNACRSIAGSPLTSGAPSHVDDRAATPARSASGWTIGTISSSSARSRTGCSLRSSGRRELQESLHDLVEPADLAGDDVDVLERLRAIHRRRLGDHRRPSDAHGLRRPRAARRRDGRG